MARHIPINTTISLAKLISDHHYYNIAALLLAEKEKNFDPLIEIFGEPGGFAELRATVNYSRFLVNTVNINPYPIGLGLNGAILRPHYHVASAILGGFKEIAYMQTQEGCPSFGLDWIAHMKHKDVLIDYYPSIFSTFGLQLP